jgi:hypothetical protein
VLHATAENLSGVFGENHNARLFPAARAAGADNTPGTDSVQPVDALHEEGDIVLPRYHGLSPLTGAQLDSLLRNRGTSTLVIAGVSLNVAIPNLVFDGVNRSYQVVVPTDTVAGTPVSYGRDVLEHGLRVVATGGQAVIDGNSHGLSLLDTRGVQLPDLANWPLGRTGVEGSLRASIDHFAASVLAKENPEPGLSAARHAQAVVAAIQESIASGGPAVVDGDPAARSGGD